MKTVAIVQARMGAQRLPGKVLLDLAGEPLLKRVVTRLDRANALEQVVVATSTESGDDAVAGLCDREGWACYRGSEHDVLDRYYHAAKSVDAEAVVRITADCPLIDPGIVDSVVHLFLGENPDYASNTVERTFPRGLDVEVMSIDTLQKVWQEAREEHERVHVTPYIYHHPELFRIVQFTGDDDFSGLRWTLDTPEDLEFARQVYARLPGEKHATWRDVLAILEAEPALATINQAIRQKPLEQG